MTVQLPLLGKQHATLVIAYAPAITNPDDAKERHFQDLKSVLTVVPCTNKLIILSDFNVRVGTDNTSWEVV